MTKSQIQQMSQGLSDLYTGLETDLIANIAEYLKSGDIYSSTAQWKIQMLAQLGSLDKANIKTISNYAGISPALLSQALETASLTAINELEDGFRQLVKDGIINGTDVPVMDTMAKALKAYDRQAKNSLNMVNTVMLYKAKSITGKIINKTAEIADKPEYIAMLSKAAGKVITGIESRQSAMRQCIQEMTDSGIPAFVDRLGREWSPEAYVNMNIRTTLSNTANTAQMERMSDYGINLVEVSSHSGARPKCAKYQGRIFDKSNKSEKYPHWKDTSYGQPDGLLGINCGHQIYPYIEGISIQRYFPYDKKENDRAYRLSQHQRELERRVRKSKRECMVLEKLGDAEGLKKASATLKNRKQALAKFSADNNLYVRTDRTAVVGYNKSVSAKVKNSLTYGSSSGKIKSESYSDLGKFKQKLRSDERITKEYYNAVKAKFSHGSDIAKKAFIKFVPENSVSNSEFMGTAHYNSAVGVKKIFMHYSADLNNERGKCVTWFHEHGHMIDDIAGNISNNSDLRRLLDADYLNYMKRYGKEHNLKTFDKVQNAISNDLETMREHSAVSDLLGGISKGNISGIAGHKADYWKDDSVICSEAFAHMYEAQFDKIRYEQMKKYFPNALKKFEEILGGLV